MLIPMFSLYPHIRDGVGRKILGFLSESHCQRIFMDWVKNYRSTNPDIDQVELRMCPLIWCRRKFDSKESTFRHVLDCPRLSTGWYWCPSCMRPERFLECNKLCSKYKPPNNDDKLHLADRFLNWICRRRSEKRLRAYSSTLSLE